MQRIALAFLVGPFVLALAAHAESVLAPTAPAAHLDILGRPLGEGCQVESTAVPWWLGNDPEPLDPEDLRRMLGRPVAWDPGVAFIHDLGRQTTGPMGSWTCWTRIADPRARRDDPLAGGWRTDDSWKLDVAGPLFVFGKVEGGSDGLGGAEVNLTGKTGVGCKVAAPLGAEVTLRGGRLLTYNDSLRSAPAQETSELFVEVQARYPLPVPGQVGLEYVGAAVPALGPDASSRVNQELRVAIPVGDSGLLRVGARHLWEDAAATRDWRAGMQVFLGLEVKPGVGRK